MINNQNVINNQNMQIMMNKKKWKTVKVILSHSKKIFFIFKNDVIMCQIRIYNSDINIKYIYLIKNYILVILHLNNYNDNISVNNFIQNIILRNQNKFLKCKNFLKGN